MKRIRNRLLPVLSVLLMLSLFQSSMIVSAQGSEEIRVGLKSLYRYVSAIQIRNDVIHMGYSVNNQFQIEETFESSNGFLCKAIKDTFYVVDDGIYSYKEAKNLADQLTKDGMIAYATTIGTKRWSVYIKSTNQQGEQANVEQRLKEQIGVVKIKRQPDNGHRILVTGNNLAFLIDGAVAGAYPQFSPVKKSEVLSLGSRSYRGRIEIGRYEKGAVTAVNIVPLEQYLYSVIASEMGDSFELEALKAQAVCARGFAVKVSGYGSDSNIKKPYQLGDTASDQVYKGYTVETSKTRQAVTETTNEFVKWNGLIVKTYYFSTSGGRTEAVEDMFVATLPYLRSEPDLYEQSPAKKPWIVSMTKETIADKLMDRGKGVGTVTKLMDEIRSISNRVYSLKIQGKNGTVSLKKSEISSILSLPSTKFKLIEYGEVPDLVTMSGSNKQMEQQIQNAYTIDGTHRVKKASGDVQQFVVLSKDNLTNYPVVTPKDKDTILFAGQGFGHGVGMSQSGANGMAKEGYNYEQILTHYYQGTTVE